QSERMRRREIERQLQVDQAEILASAASQRGTEAIKDLSRPQLRSVDQQRKLLARLDLVDGLNDERVARQRFLERREDLERFAAAALPRQEASIALHHA